MGCEQSMKLTINKYNDKTAVVEHPELFRGMMEIEIGELNLIDGVGITVESLTMGGGLELVTEF